MERKGSGFGKILDAYEFQVNYKEDKKTSFRSDRASFFAIMPNLNYLSDNVAHNVAHCVAHCVAQTLAEIIIEEIQKDNKVTRDRIATIANVSKKTVERELKKMNNVRYIGSGSGGHLVIIVMPVGGQLFRTFREIATIHSRELIMNDVSAYVIL